jgi:hypothetical protein
VLDRHRLDMEANNEHSLRNTTFMFDFIPFSVDLHHRFRVCARFDGVVENLWATVWCVGIVSTCAVCLVMPVVLVWRKWLEGLWWRTCVCVVENVRVCGTTGTTNERDVNAHFEDQMIIDGENGFRRVFFDIVLRAIFVLHRWVGLL